MEHVFLSYNRADWEAVEWIARWLEGQGIRPWLDRWQLTPGVAWPDELAKAVRGADAYALILSHHGPGTWTREEARLAQDRAAKDDAFRAFIVLLPGADVAVDPSFAFLTMRTWVDLRGGFKEPAGLDMLRWALTNDAPEHAPPPPPLVRPTLLALPEDRAVFTGRDPELEDLIAELTGTADEPRLTAIVGQPGIGKTALAVRAAHRLRDDFPEGRFYLDLQGYQPRPLSAGDAALQLLPALGVRDAEIPDSVELRVALVRERLRGRRALVLLDNLRTIDQIEGLIPADPRPAFLLTSRGTPAPFDGRIVTLDLLSSDAAKALLRAIVKDDARTEDDGAVEEIVRLCGRLPLAVRIAAGLLKQRRHWTAADLVQRLSTDERLDVLQLGTLAVRTAFDSSFAALSEQQRMAFSLLGAIRAPDFPAWMVGALLDVDARRGEEVLEELADAQLVTVTGRTASGAFRFALHDLMKLFAREHLEALPGRASADERLLSSLVALGLAQLPRIGPGNDRTLATRLPLTWTPSPETLERELTVEPMLWFLEQRLALVSAAREAYARRLWPYVWAITDILEPIFVLTTHGAESPELKRLAIDAARQAQDENAEIGIRSQLPGMLLNQGRWGDAVEILTEVLAGYEQRGDELGVARTELFRAVVQRDRGHLDAAAAGLERSIPMHRRLGDDLGVAATQHNYAIVLREQGKLAEAATMLDACIPVFERRHDLIALGRALHCRALVLRYTGATAEAEQLLDRALGVCLETGDRRWAGIAILGLARMRVAAGDWEHAAAELARARETFADIHDEIGTAQVKRTEGIISRRRGDLDAAERLLREARAPFERGDIRSEAKACCSLALVFERRGEPALAAAELRRAGSLLESARDEPWLARVASIRARLP